MNPWLLYPIAFLVLLHGFIYVRIGSALPGPVPGWRGTSWLFGQALADDTLTELVIDLHVVAGIVIFACGAAIALAPIAPGLWRPLAVAGTLVGIAGFAVFWDGQVRMLLEEGAIGAIVSAILLGTALTLPRVFG